MSPSVDDAVNNFHGTDNDGAMNCFQIIVIAIQFIFTQFVYKTHITIEALLNSQNRLRSVPRDL